MHLDDYIAAYCLLLSYFSTLTFHFACHLASFIYSLGCILTILNLHVQISMLRVLELHVADWSAQRKLGDIIADSPDLSLYMALEIPLSSSGASFSIIFCKSLVNHTLVHSGDVIFL